MTPTPIAIVLAALALGCRSGATSDPPSSVGGPFTSEDAATLPSTPAPAAREPDPAVAALVEDTCASSLDQVCPDKRRCVDLGFFGVRSARCGDGGVCAVCFRVGTSERDIACPAGTELRASFVGIPDWHCASP